MLEHHRNAALAVAFVCAPGLAMSADFDGSKPLICATVETHDCVAGDTCVRALPRDVGVPQFMRIDFDKKTIAGPNRTTAIMALNKSGQQMTLQGTELGFAWTIAINTYDGSMAASLVADNNVIAVFGACTPL